MRSRFSVILRAVAFLSVIAVLCVACFVCPKQEYSAAERRPLASFPSLTLNSIMSGKFTADLETYTVDHFPLRDTWRTFKAYVSKTVFRQQDQNGLYCHNGSVADMEYPLNAASVANACTIFGDIYEQYLKDSGSAVYTTVVPDKNAFLAADSGHLHMDYAAFYKQFEEQTPFATYIPIDHLLTADSYFATDSHWKQEALLPVAQALCAAMGTATAAEHTVQSADQPFFGVYSGQYALPLEADTLCTVHSDATDAMTVFDMEHQTAIPLYDMSRLTSDDPYEVFVGGSVSLVTIDNPSATTDRELIMVRDSFGSSVAPLLAEGYATVTLVDIRYLSRHQLSRYIDFHGQDVLFLYSTSTLNNSETFK